VTNSSAWPFLPSRRKRSSARIAGSIVLIRAIAHAQAPAQQPGNAATPAPAPQAPAPQAAPPPYAYPPYAYPPPAYYPYYPNYYPYYPPPPHAPAEPPRWKPGEPAPPGYYVEKRADWKLITGGSLLLGTFWTVSIIGAMNVKNEGESNSLYVPVVGPFFAMGFVESKGAQELLLIDGILQSVGVLEIVAGALGGEEHLVRIDAALGPKLRVAPAVSRQWAGLHLAGKF
jgi:hypothetical protein